MSRARPNHRTAGLHVRVPEELRAAVIAAAEERDVSVNWLMTKALEDFLPRLLPASEFRLTRD